MSTTSLKLSDVLKQRAATAAEHQARFVAKAVTARKTMLKSGEGYDAGEVHAYIRERVSGKKSARPKAKSWRR